MQGPRGAFPHQKHRAGLDGVAGPNLDGGVDFREAENSIDLLDRRDHHRVPGGETDASALVADPQCVRREVAIGNVFSEELFERIDRHVGHGVARAMIMIASLPRSAHRAQRFSPMRTRYRPP